MRKQKKPGCAPGFNFNLAVSVAKSDGRNRSDFYRIDSYLNVFLPVADSPSTVFTSA
jgi:hypothetical protein